MVFWAIRFFGFRLLESPKYLMGKGRDADAVDVIHKIAKRNGRTSTLTLDSLQSFDKFDTKEEPRHVEEKNAASKFSIRSFYNEYMQPLFATPKVAWSTSLLLLIWGEMKLMYHFLTTFLILCSSGRHCFTLVCPCHRACSQ